MRLFIALELPEQIRECIALTNNAFSSMDIEAKWVPTGNMHITLKFLGEVAENALAKVKQCITDAVANVESFDVTIEGTGSFGRPPRVVWAGVGEGREEIAAVMRSLENALSFIMKESREATPHMTIARIASCADVKRFMECIEDMKTRRFGSFRAESIALKKSVLKPEGPVYSTIETFKFGAT